MMQGSLPSTTNLTNHYEARHKMGMKQTNCDSTTMASQTTRSYVGNNYIPYKQKTDIIIAYTNKDVYTIRVPYRIWCVRSYDQDNAYYYYYYYYQM